MMTRGHRQEALSRAYVATIAGLAGCVCCKPEPDYGIDLTLREVDVRGERLWDTSLQIDLQVRSTTRATVGESEVVYDLDVDTYNDLRTTTRGSPRLLVLFVMPEDESEWVSQSVEELCLRRSCYWVSLEGQPPTAATATIRIRIPTTQVFSTATILTLFEQAKQRRQP